MNIAVFLCLLTFFYFDLATLRRQDGPLFHNVFRLSHWFVWLYGILALVLTAIPGYAADEKLSTYLFLFVLPFYIIKRVRFKKQFKKNSVFDENSQRELSLATDAFDIVLLWFVGLVVIATIIRGYSTLFPQLDSKLGEVVVLSTLSFLLMIALIVKKLKKYPQLKFRYVMGLHDNEKAWWQLYLLPIFAGLTLAGVSSFIILSRSSQPVTPLSSVLESTTSSSVLLAFLGAAVLLAPFFEEIIFRGFFFHVVDQFKGRRFAIILIAAIFGLMHFEQYWGDWMVMGIVTLLGFILTMFRSWTGSSIPGIVMHYVFNGTMTIIPIVVVVLSNPIYFEYQANYIQLSAEKKEELLLESIEAYPDHADSYNDLAWLYAEEGRNLDEALDLIEKALAAFPDRYAYLDTKAEVLYQKGFADKALAIERDLLERYPENEYIQNQVEKFSKALGTLQKE